MTEVLRSKIDFPKTTLITKDTSKIENNLVLAPPAVLGNAWVKNWELRIWLCIGVDGNKRCKKKRTVDRSFVLSDTQTDGLLSVLIQLNENVITTHGYTDIFAKYLNEQD